MFMEHNYTVQKKNVKRKMGHAMELKEIWAKSNKALISLKI